MFRRVLDPWIMFRKSFEPLDNVQESFETLDNVQESFEPLDNVQESFEPLDNVNELLKVELEEEKDKLLLGFIDPVDAGLSSEKNIYSFVQKKFQLDIFANFIFS